MFGSSVRRAVTRHTYIPGSTTKRPCSKLKLMADIHNLNDIAGTVIFDGAEAMKGYALNKMCFSLNSRSNREAFLANEDSYCEKYGLNEAQRDAVRKRDVLALIATGGNVYYLAKLAGAFGLNVQDIGAQQTGMPLEDFKTMLANAGA
jgi:protocatechuate 4,5-dioxygenase alpha chain